ncbi:MAG: tRNA pseudouridine(55) synthase TruB [Lachnospiraceae bacterium]|nr:tRNA pseudouridine(55) synthase TruB [Lachnospiraceae bacterium]
MDGIINVYKEKGYTSHDVVARLRGITGERHIGHTGTLDPAAAGVLPLCLGTTTKACELLTDKGKCYETILLLGIETDTEDATGEIVSNGDVSNITDEMIKEAVASFKGEILQVPPMFSATRINGQRSYSLARQGINIEREAKKITVNEISIVSEIQRGSVKDKESFVPYPDSMLARYPEDAEEEEGRWRWENNSLNREESLNLSVIRVALRIDCEKGTYIRTICADIGKKLGCGGCMERLLRTRSGDFHIEESHSLAELEVIFEGFDKKNPDNTPIETKNRINSVLLSADRCFMEYPALHSKEKYDSILLNGNLMWMRHFKEYIETPDPINRVYDSKNEFKAIYEWVESRKLYKPLKVFISTKE